MARRPRPAPPAGPRRRAARRRAGPRRLPRHRHLRVGACGRNASSRHLPPLCVPLGTGGDGTDTVNISTGSTILAAAAGAKVTKQGSRASSSACGSADVLEVLGVNIELEPEVLPDWPHDRSFSSALAFRVPDILVLTSIGHFNRIYSPFLYDS